MEPTTTLSKEWFESEMITTMEKNYSGGNMLEPLRQVGEIPTTESAAAVPILEDRRFYWWRCGPDGHWLIVMVRNGLCLMPGFSQAHKLADQKGEFWPAPLNPPRPNDPHQATASDGRPLT